MGDPAPQKRVKTPTLLQMEAAECGAASLGIVLAHHGCWVALEELREECGVSRDGSKASNVLRAAKQYGLAAKGYRKEPEQLRSLPVPAIIHWNFNHFVVLEGFDGKTAFINDPASGPRSMSMEELDHAFTGVVLTFEPTDDLKAKGEKPRLIPALARRLRGSELALVFVVLAGLFLVVPGLVIPVFTKVFVDDILVGGDGDWLRPLFFGMVITAVLRGALTWLQRHYLLRLSMKLAISFSAKFLWHVLGLPMRFFSARYPGDIASRIELNDRLAGLLSGELATTILSASMVIFYAALMLYYDPLLTLIGVAFALCNLFVLRAMSRRRVALSHRLLQERGKLIGVSMGGLQLIETLKASGGESDFFSHWAGQYAKVVNAEQEMEVSSQVVSLVPPLLAGLNTILILGLGALRVMDGHMTIGMLVAFQSLMASFSGPVEQLVGLGGALQEVEGDIARLDDVLRHPKDPLVESSAPSPRNTPPNARPIPGRLSGRVALDGVTFGYNPRADPLIRDFSLDLSPGARVALVGGSGSGKSTTAKLVAGLYQPWQGVIRFDGAPREEIPRSVVNDSVAMVDQEIFLFAGTIRENLTMWDPTVPDADVVRAAKDACIHEDIAALAMGYDALVDEGGRNFSGGQRQRLEIARALVNNPAVLVLDEATSALDTKLEKEIDDNVRRRGCTCLVIAHRLSTIRDADEILVLERGEVVERGTHQTLVSAEGAYARLIESA